MVCSRPCAAARSCGLKSPKRAPFLGGRNAAHYSSPGAPDRRRRIQAGAAVRDGKRLARCWRRPRSTAPVVRWRPSPSAPGAETTRTVLRRLRGSYDAAYGSLRDQDLEGNHYSQVRRLDSKLPAVHQNDPDCLRVGLLSSAIRPDAADPPESLVHGVDGGWSNMELPMRSRIARASFAVKARKLWLARPNSFGLHGKCMIPTCEWPLIWISK
jgi:hypothetical protein